MTESTLALIEDRFLRSPSAKASPVSATEFDGAFSKLLLNLDPDYREFVLRYGGGFVGSRPIYGLKRAPLMGTIGGHATAPEVTAWFRGKHWPGTERWLVFSVDHGGNPVGFAPDQTVWLSDQLDFGQIVQLGTGFEDYLLKWCLRVRNVT